MVGISAAGKSLYKYEEKAPQGDDTDKNVIKDSKSFTLIEYSAVKEENTELDAGVCELFDDQSGIIELSRLSSQLRFDAL